MAIMTVGSGAIPAGNYALSFMGCEVQPENKEKGYAVGTRFKFTIDSPGPVFGQTASRVTGNVPNPQNACGRMLAGLIGHALKEREQIDPDAYIGKKYIGIVAISKGGGTRVETIVPMG